jgi:hypothetical protein
VAGGGSPRLSQRMLELGQEKAGVKRKHAPVSGEEEGEEEEEEEDDDEEEGLSEEY